MNIKIPRLMPKIMGSNSSTYPNLTYPIRGGYAPQTPL